MSDIRIDFHGLYHNTAAVSGLTVPGASLVRSNGGGTGASVEMPRGRAEDFAAFAERRGLRVELVNRHATGGES
jgi:hypothetical protein